MYAYDSTTKDGPGSQHKPTKNPSRTAAPVLAAHSALALQRAAGNAAVTSLLGAGRGGRGHLLPPTVSGSIVRPRQTTDQSLVVARAPVDSRGGTDTTSTRPAGPGPGIRAGGDVSVSAGATVTVEAALRQVYAESARQISEAARDMIRAGTKPEDAARWAVEARNDLKRQIRQRGSVIVKGLAEARNIRKYGNKIGPTYEELIRQGKTPKDIIGKAGKASVRWNRVGSIMKVGGWFLIVVDIAIVTWDVAHAEEGEKVRTATRGVGGIAGALAGG